MSRRFVLAGALFGMFGVALGAFGTHTLRASLEGSGRLDTYQTAVQYQLIHALALIGAGWAAERWPGRFTRLAGLLFSAGIFLFSGSLYLLAIFNLGVMGAVAPLGGAALIAGWGCLAWAAWRGG